MLSVKNLTITVEGATPEQTIVNQVSFEIKPQSVFALVGGSGSGKTTTGLSILKLLPSALKIVSGEIIFQGHSLLNSSEAHMRTIRGKDIGMVFQEPLTAFNPVFTIGYQIDEVLKAHSTFSALERDRRITELLNIVGLAQVKRVAQSYPHQLSGGMRQRAMIAQAIALNPPLIIADEPTSSLDVTLQARIIELFKRLKDEFKLSILLITHDLGMVEHMADEVAVLAKGEVVEYGTTPDLMTTPKHPFAVKLMNALRV
jgi:ABC-type dipeptide/oligopeptide/nickel transport system ATPase component